MVFIDNMLAIIYPDIVTNRWISMKFFAARDLRTIPKSIWQALASSSETRPILTVIDTNVLVSSLLSRDGELAKVRFQLGS